MTVSTNDAEVEQVLSAIRNLIVQSRSPEKPAPLLLTPELRIAEPIRQGGPASPDETPDARTADEPEEPVQTDSEGPKAEPPMMARPQEPEREEPSHLRLVAESEPAGADAPSGAMVSEEEGAFPRSGLADADEAPAGVDPVPVPQAPGPVGAGPEAGLPDLAGFLALVGLPPELETRPEEAPAPAQANPEPAEPAPAVAGSLPLGSAGASSPDRSDAVAEEPAAWVEPEWPELNPPPAPEADPAALPGSALGALLAEEVPDLPAEADAPVQPDDVLRDRVAALVREALEGEMDRLRAIVREEARLALQGSGRP